MAPNLALSQHLIDNAIISKLEGGDAPTDGNITRLSPSTTRTVAAADRTKFALEQLKHHRTVPSGSEILFAPEMANRRQETRYRSHS